jgi:class 3 adenylate cyclase
MLESLTDQYQRLHLKQIGQNLVNTIGIVLKVDLAILLICESQESLEQYFIYQQTQFKKANRHIKLETLKLTVKITEEMILVEDIPQSLSKVEDLSPQQQAYLEANIYSTMSVPLINQPDLTVVLALHHCQQVHIWQEEEVQIALMMASQGALVIYQVFAYEAMQALAKREGTINRITAAIRSSLEPQSIFTAITTELGQALRVDGCTLSLWTKEDKYVQCVGLYDPNQPNPLAKQDLPKSSVAIADNPILQKLLATQKPVVIADLQQHPEMARYDLPWHFCNKALLIVPLIVDGEIIGSITLRQSSHSRSWHKSDLDLAEAVASQAAIAVQQARLYETTKQQAELLIEREKKVKELNNYLTESVLKRFLPESIVNKAAVGELVLDLNPEPHRVTILFADLVGFTPLSSQLGSRRLAEFLNEYLEAMAKAVFEQGGTVDKFLGDGIMALFGAPESLTPSEQAQKAIAAAKQMHHYLKELNNQWQLKKLLIKDALPTLQLRCGIHQGKAVVGMFGGKQRKDYTAIGTAVNIASRLQEAAEADTILVSATVAVCLEVQEIKQVSSLQLKGIEEKVIAFSVALPTSQVPE